MKNNLSVIRGKDPFGVVSYFGYKNTNQHTEDHYSIQDLTEQYPEFNNAIVKIRGKNDYNFEGSESGRWTFKIKDNIDLITDNIIDSIEKFDERIYFNNASGTYFIFDFKVDDVWIEAGNINCNDMTMDLVLFKW